MQSMDVMDGMEKGRMWYNKMGWVGFRRTVKVSKKNEGSREMPQNGMDETLISNCAEPAAGRLTILHPVDAVPD